MSYGSSRQFSLENMYIGMVGLGTHRGGWHRVLPYSVTLFVFLWWDLSMWTAFVNSVSNVDTGDWDKAWVVWSRVRAWKLNMVWIEWSQVEERLCAQNVYHGQSLNIGSMNTYDQTSTDTECGTGCKSENWEYEWSIGLVRLTRLDLSTGLWGWAGLGGWMQHGNNKSGGRRHKNILHIVYSIKYIDMAELIEQSV